MSDVRVSWRILCFGGGLRVIGRRSCCASSASSFVLGGGGWPVLRRDSLPLNGPPRSPRRGKY